jgi:hypothetical protein
MAGHFRFVEVIGGQKRKGPEEQGPCGVFMTLNLTKFECSKYIARFTKEVFSNPGFEKSIRRVFPCFM